MIGLNYMSEQASSNTDRKPVVNKKLRYFVPALGKTVEAENLEEVAEIVKKENAAPKGKGEQTKGQN